MLPKGVVRQPRPVRPARDPRTRGPRPSCHLYAHATFRPWKYARRFAEAVRYDNMPKATATGIHLCPYQLQSGGRWCSRLSRGHRVSGDEPNVRRTLPDWPFGTGRGSRHQL